MTWNMTNRWWVVFLLVALVACNKDNDLEIQEGSQYLTHVIEEKKIEKTELAAQITDFISGQGINLPEALILGLLRDIDVAAIEYNTVGADGSTVTASGVIAIPSGTISYVSIRQTTGIKPLYTTIATVTMNLIVSAAIVLLNLYITVYINY